MRFNPVLKTAASLAALSFATALAGSAIAQTQPGQAQPGQTPPIQSVPPGEEVMPGDAGTDVTAPTGPSTAPPRAMTDIGDAAAQPAGIPTSSPTPVEQAYLLKAGDPTVVSNPPVPDTPETRSAFGGPDSNGGKKTRAVGN